MTSNPATSETNDALVGRQQGQLVLPGSRAKEATPIGQPHYNTPKRSDPGKATPSLPSRRVPGQLQPFNEATSSPLTDVRYMPESSSALQDQLNHSTTKAGLCIICSCTNPHQGEPIINCTAPQKMNKCLGEDLGFSVIEVNTDLSTETMIRLLYDFGRLQVPKSCEEHFRFFFYFFGHGSSTEICLTNGNLERSTIVNEVQKVNKSLCKIVLFDSCRVEEEKSLEEGPYQYNLEPNVDRPIEATEGGSLSDVFSSLHIGGPEWKAKEKYPNSINTLVIYATEDRGKAYYPDNDRFPAMKGCGLVTYFFTELAPALNQPLSAVLTEVRQKVDQFIKYNCSLCSRVNPQVLVFEHRLMENVNLLAESKGKERVKPKIEDIKTTPIETTVQWGSCDNVDHRIKEFKLVCRNEQTQPVEIQDKQILKNVAQFSNEPLHVETTYYIKVVAVYDDGFTSESDESSFTTVALPFPCDITTTAPFPGGPTATVHWEIDGNDTDIIEFLVQVNEREAKKVKHCARETKICGLMPSTTYQIRVSAIYKDNRKTECHEVYHNGELNRAEITSLELMKLNPLTLDVHWEVEGEAENQPQVEYQLSATGGRAKIPLANCDAHGQLELLEHGTEYSLTVTTCYKEELCLESEKVFTYTTPEGNELKPTITSFKKRKNDVIVRVSVPSAFRKEQFSINNIKLKKVFLKRTSEENENECLKFKIWDSEGGEEEPVEKQVVLGGIIPGKRYRVSCEVECDSERDLLSDDDDLIISTITPPCIQKTFNSSWFIFSCCLAFFLFLVCSAMTYIPYSVYLKGSDRIHTYYALTKAEIECGTGNSQKHDGIHLSGSLEKGDTLDGPVEAWLVLRDDLKLYTRPAGPFYSGYTPLPGDHYVQLLGWTWYLWEGSIIYGYCCVQNNNSTDQTASLFVFTTIEDSIHFRAGNSPKNYIHTENLLIPQSDFCCFRTLDIHPFKVNESSYYFFVIEFAADNMNFTAKIEYHQNYVNTSDYSNSHKFQYNTHTYFKFPTGATHPTEYVAICRASDYFNLNKSTHPEAESLHINSRGTLHKWAPVFLLVLIVSTVGALIYCAACCCLFKLHHSCVVANLWTKSRQIFLKCIYSSRREYVNINH